MKTNKLFAVFAAIALVLGMASCSQPNGAPNGANGGKPAKVKTVAIFSAKTPAATVTYTFKEDKTGSLKFVLATTPAVKVISADGSFEAMFTYTGDPTKAGDVEVTLNENQDLPAETLELLKPFVGKMTITEDSMKIENLPDAIIEKEEIPVEDTEDEKLFLTGKNDTIYGDKITFTMKDASVDTKTVLKFSYNRTKSGAKEKIDFSNIDAEILINDKKIAIPLQVSFDLDPWCGYTPEGVKVEGENKNEDTIGCYKCEISLNTKLNKGDTVSFELKSANVRGEGWNVVSVKNLDCAVIDTDHTVGSYKEIAEGDAYVPFIKGTKPAPAYKVPAFVTEPQGANVIAAFETDKMMLPMEQNTLGITGFVFFDNGKCLVYMDGIALGDGTPVQEVVKDPSYTGDPTKDGSAITITGMTDTICKIEWGNLNVQDTQGFTQMYLFGRM